VVIDSRDEVVHLLGNAGDYLKFSEGGFTRNIFKLTQHNLASALRSALIRAQQKGDRFTYENVRFKVGRKFRTIRLHVRPMPDKHGKLTGSRLVFFEPIDAPRRADKEARGSRSDNATARRIVDLERDLSLTRESLQATVQDLETSNEEIQAANEELLAANEELQSTNEELQSVNEELHTVNVENQSRIEELSRLTNDINNLLATASVGVLLIDGDLRVRRASRSALLTLDLTESDLGVPIETVARILHASDLPQIAERVMRSGQAEEHELERPGGGRWVLTRCVPFRNELGRTHGVVLTLIDITERHIADRRLLTQAAITQGVLDAMEASVAVLDREGRIVHLNKSWRGLAAQNGALGGADLELGANYFEACSQNAGLSETEAATATACLEGMRKVMRGELTHFVYDYPCEAPNEQRWYRLHAVGLHAPEPGLAVAHFDITAQKHAEQLLAARGVGQN
jgi:two-component system CheB/CheR fusion protein